MRRWTTYGERLAFQQFPARRPFPQMELFTQSFNTSDIGLKNSPLFGGKAGYFFKDEGFNWLGVELEAFYVPADDQRARRFQPAKR